MVFILKWAKSSLLQAIYILTVLNFQMINYFFYFSGISFKVTLEESWSSRIFEDL